MEEQNNPATGLTTQTENLNNQTQKTPSAEVFLQNKTNAPTNESENKEIKNTLLQASQQPKENALNNNSFKEEQPPITLKPENSTTENNLIPQKESNTQSNINTQNNNLQNSSVDLTLSTTNLSDASLKNNTAIQPQNIKTSNENSNTTLLQNNQNSNTTTQPQKNENKFVKTLKTNKSRLLPSVLIALILPLVLCIVAPFEIYSNNMEEFTFAVADFMPMCLLIAFVLFTLIFALLYLLPKKAYKITAYVFLGLGLLVFLQSTYLNNGLSSLGGDNMGVASTSVFVLILNTFIWIALITAFVFLALKTDKNGIIKTICYVSAVVVLATQFVSFMTISLTSQGVFLSKVAREQVENSDYKLKALTTKNLNAFSETNNVFYFVVDRFDESYAEQAFNKHPEIFEEFTGFTWFQDNISLYGHTYPAITYMLTNQQLDPEKERKEHLKTAYEQATPLDELNAAGYDVNLYTEPYYAYTSDYLPNYVKNFSTGKSSVSSKFGLAINLIAMAAYRSMPLVLQQNITALQSDSCDKFITFTDASGNNKFTTDNKNIWNNINNNTVDLTTNKNFSFIHMAGCHGVNYDENFNKVSRKNSKDMNLSVKNSFKIIQKYLKKLKDNNLYESSTIIITGDHSAPENDSKNISSPALTALFVKPAGVSSGDLEISNAQVSQGNIWATIMKSEGLSTALELGKSVFDIPENENQTRTHKWQTYVSGSLDEYTYSITASGKNFENWELVNTKHYNKHLMD